MLVLSRKLNEKIIIDGNIYLTVLRIQGNQVRLGIEAPGHIGIFREELGTAPFDRGDVEGPTSTERPSTEAIMADQR